MKCSLNYRDILKKHCKKQPEINLVYKQFSLIRFAIFIPVTFWRSPQVGISNALIDTILFHARLVGDRVIIEEDNFEEGLSSALIVAGIPPEHIITGLNYQSGAIAAVSSGM